MISIPEIKKNGMYFVKQNYWYSVLAALILSKVSINVLPNFNFIGLFNDVKTNSIFTDKFSGSFFIIFAFLLFTILFFVLFLMVVALKIFALNPMRSGCIEYMHRNIFSKPSFINVFNGFRNNYKSKVKTLFFVDLYTFLWGLLFIVPGIVKSYQYRLVPYIIAENPSVSTNDALKLSCNMMNGNKGAAFLYDLSFIGWALLTVLSFGIVGVFYYYPYKTSSDAVLYETVKRAYNSDTE